MKLFRLRIILLFAVFLFITAYTYRGLPQTFYQQDEWHSLGQMLSGGLAPFVTVFPWIARISGAGRILSLPISYALYMMTPFSAVSFSLFAYVAHAVNALFLYWIIRMFVKNFWASAAGVIYFLTAHVHHQGITWISATTTTLMSQAFALAAIYAALKVHRSQDRRLWISLGLAIVSVLFKETSAFLLILLPCIIMWKRRTKPISRQGVIAALPFFAFAVFLVGSRMLGVAQGVGAAGRVGGGVWVLLLRALVYPYEAIAQMFVPAPVMISAATRVTTSLYPYLKTNPAVSLLGESIFSDFLSLGIATVVIGIATVVYIRDKSSRVGIVFGFLYILLSALPVSILAKPGSYLESRYYYAITPGAALLLSVFAKSMYAAIARRIYPIVSFTVVAMAVMMLVRVHLSNVHATVKDAQMISHDRLMILRRIREIVPNLGEKTVFTVVGETDFIVPDNPLPFQQGVGYTLMVWYYDQGVVPAEFLLDDFLWDLASQGYRESADGRGFGYFTDGVLLKEAVETYDIPAQNIYSLQYDALTKTISASDSSQML